MEVHQLQLLRELGELGSVTAVAQTLYVTPSAVSQQLAQLQKSVGVPLTRKQGRTLVLTSAGRALADAGGDVVQAMAKARAAVALHHEATTGTVTLCGFHSAGQALFGALLRRVASLPGLDVRLADEDVAEQEFGALTSRYDLVLAHRLSHTGSWDSPSIASRTLIEEPFDVAVPAGHPLAAKASLSPADVAGERWVTSHPGFSPDDVLNAIAVVAGQKPEVVHRVNDYGSVAAIAAAGSALGLMPRFLATAYLPEGLVLLPLRGISITRRVDLLARPENLTRAAVSTVAEALAECVRDVEKL